MKTTDLIRILTECVALNGDLPIYGVVNGRFFEEIEINADSESHHIELYR